MSWASKPLYWWGVWWETVGDGGGRILNIGTMMEISPLSVYGVIELFFFVCLFLRVLRKDRVL